MGEIIPFEAGYHPLLGHLMWQMGLPETINDMTGAAEHDTLVDLGTATAAMIQHILGDEPIRLYRLEDFFGRQAIPLILPWQPELPPSAFNDDMAGRALDALHAAGPQKVFSALARRVIELYALDVQLLHADTTSRSFYGVYAEAGDDAVLQITHGYSKDQRPDLKQILFGVGVTREGIPVLGDVLSGNRSDMKTLGKWARQVRQQLGQEGDSFLVYVADSAVVTEENLPLLRSCLLNVISRLPHRFALAEELIDQALGANQWAEIGYLSEWATAEYAVWETEAELAGAVYRFLVVRSSSLDQRRLKALDRAVSQERNELEKALKKVQQDFVCQPDAQAHLPRVLQELRPKYHRLSGEVVAEEKRLKRPRPGRPRQGEEPPTVTRYRWDVRIERDEEAYQQARNRCGMFVLLTDLRDPVVSPAVAVLSEYKGQQGAERIFRFLKDPAWVGAICLKKPGRIVALGYVMLMAAMVYTLLERQVRKALEPEEVAPIEGLNRRKTKQPTAYALQTALSTILVIAEIEEGHQRYRPGRPLSVNQRRILELTGFSESIYHWEGSIPPPMNPAGKLHNSQRSCCEM